MLYTKSAGWKYEREYRVIRVIADGTPEQREVRAMGLSWNGRFATLPDNALIGVTLGAAMGDVAGELTAEIAAERPSPEVWQARVGTIMYTLEFHRIR